MKGDDYATRRHFWVHFWCGLVVGGGLGAWVCWGEITSRWGFWGCVALIALFFAYTAGKLGDRFWYWILRNWE